VTSVASRDRRFDTLFSGAREPLRIGMDFDRETIVEITAAVVPVVLFIAFLLYLGSKYTEGEDLTSTGGLAVIGLLALFILAMAGVGYYLANADY